eukprot:9770963-Ditylum_brightwellii.AAC.1
MDDTFYLHTAYGDKVRFGAARKGIYAMDTDTSLSSSEIWTRKIHHSNHPMPVYLETVEENKKKYPER